MRFNCTMPNISDSREDWRMEHFLLTSQIFIASSLEQRFGIQLGRSQSILVEILPRKVQHVAQKKRARRPLSWKICLTQTRAARSTLWGVDHFSNLFEYNVS